MKRLIQALVASIVLLGSSAVQAQGISYATGLLPAHPDDLVSVPTRPLGRNFLPEIVDLSDRMPPVGDQGRLGSCVSWAVGYAARSYYNGVQTQQQISQSAIPAVNYMHGILRVPDPEEGPCGGGAYIHKALEFLSDEGAPSLASMPYSDSRCDVPDSRLREQVRQSGTFRISNYYHLNATGLGGGGHFLDSDTNFQMELIKNELALGHPVVIGVDVDRAFFELRGRSVWQALQEPGGGHAITLVGYNEREQYFKFINSWGTSWGDRGYGRLSYDAYRRQNYATPMSMRIAGVEPIPPSPIGPGPGPIGIEDRIDLPAFECGHVEIARADGQRKLMGFVQRADDMVELERIAAGYDDLTLDVELRPWPVCEVLLTLRDPLLDRAAPAIILDQDSFIEGETLSFAVEMAPFEGFLHLAYVQADGTVVHLAQQDAARLHTLERGTRLTFGDGLEGRPHFAVSGPFGTEMIVAIASASPLFREPRDQGEIERLFLSALREAILARPDPNAPARRVSASYFILETLHP